jgi:hypothetical protein
MIIVKREDIYVESTRVGNCYIQYYLWAKKKIHSLDDDHKVSDFRVPIQIQIQKIDYGFSFWPKDNIVYNNYQP